MARKKKPVNRKSWIRQRLRRISLRWPARNNVLKASRRELPRKIKKDGTPYKRPNFEYQCNMCKGWFRSSDVQVDHINPVMDLNSSPELSEAEWIGEFAVSLLCWEDNLQILCENCHDIKTLDENEIRKENKCKKS